MKETKGKPKKDAGPKGNASAPSQKGRDHHLCTAVYQQEEVSDGRGLSPQPSLVRGGAGGG